MVKVGLPEIVNEVSKATGLSRIASQHVIMTFLSRIEAHLASPEDTEIRIQGFGKFWTAMARARQARNPRTGDLLEIPETRRCRFSPFKALVERIQGPKKPVEPAAPVVVLRKKRAAKS